jgi:hypothetical protein
MLAAAIKIHRFLDQSDEEEPARPMATPSCQYWQLNIIIYECLNQECRSMLNMLF